MVCRYPGDQSVRRLCVHQIVRQAEGDAEDQENSPDHEAALGHHPRQVTNDAQVPVYHRGNDEGVESGNGRRLHGSGEAAGECQHRHHRQAELPLGAVEGCTHLPPVEFRPILPGLAALLHGHTPGGDDGEHERCRQESAQEHLPQADLRHDGVEDQRQGRNQQHPGQPGRGHQSQRRALAVTGTQQQRHRQPPQGENRDPGGAREGGEKGTGEYRDECSATAHPAEKRVKEHDQAFRCLALCQQVARKSEHGDRGQRRIDDQAVVVDGECRGRHAGIGEQKQRGAPDHGEDRRAQQQCDTDDGQHRSGGRLRTRQELLQQNKRGQREHPGRHLTSV